MAEETLQRLLSNRFVDALALACDLHRTQARKGTKIPYEAIAAVLHDAFEDQGGAATASR